MHFLEVGDNLFLIEFYSEQDIYKVKMSRPWSFDRNLLYPNPFDGSCSLKDIIFYKESIWLQIYNIPLSGMTHGIREQVGMIIGAVEAMYIDGDGIGWSPYLRVNV